MFRFKTDMASEAQRRSGAGLAGVSLEKSDLGGIPAETVSVTDRISAELLGKPIGKYTTIDVSSLSDLTQNTLLPCAEAIAKTVTDMLPPLDIRETVLAVGLGNRKITSDSLGPDSADGIIATRHLFEDMPHNLGSLRPVAVFTPGVLGSTGIESGETVAALVSALRPRVCVLIDALASSDHGGLCKSVQISNTGISPGSGVANHRFEISPQTVGIPCVSIGVPTVVEARTLISAFAQKQGIDEESFLFDVDEDSFFLTPKDIDRLSPLCARAISLGVNMAFQPDLSASDIEALQS